MSVDELAPGIRRVLAPNPSFMTGRGTNSYLVGTGRVAVIDPGPADPAHLDALVEAGAGAIACVLVTHHHTDHAPGAVALAERLDVPLLAFGMPGRLEPDHRLSDGEVVDLDSMHIEVLHTPGHASDHLCYLVGADAPDGLGVPLLFSGDTVMGSSSVMIAPPDGDMGTYLRSLARLMTVEGGTLAIAPGHGELISDGRRELEAYLERRRMREAAVVAALERAPASAGDLVPIVYPGLDPVLRWPATMSTWAHLRHLRDQDRAACDAPGDPEAIWRSRSKRA